MLTILFYCLKVLLYSGLLFGYYLLALRNKQFHQWNRYYLLAIAILSFALPFIHIPIFYSGNASHQNIILRGLQFGDYGDEVIIRPHDNWKINWSNLLIVLYTSISIFFLIKLCKTFNWINKIKANYPSEMLADINFYNTEEDGTPFSFFKNIFWHTSIEPSSSKGLQMLRHEITHVRQLHSADKLLMEISTIIAWWNPFFYIIKKELSTIHEFIADQQAAPGDDNLQYASLLLQSAFGSNNIPLSNPFFHSQLKRRIAMLTTIKNPRFSYLRRLMVLPLAAALFMSMAFKFKEKKNNDLKTPVPLTIVIDAGHGGIDDGATNKSGLKEKDITLAIAQKINELATARNISIILTRKGDELPGNSKTVNDGLKQRIAMATNNKADLFISLHVNNSNLAASSGVSAMIGKTGSNSTALNPLIASALLDELQKSGLYVFNNIQQSNGEQGVFVLDKNPLPSVLLELGFINNPTDAAYISDPKNQEKLANEILDGIVKASVGLKNKGDHSVAVNQPYNANILQGYLQDTTKTKKSKPFDNVMHTTKKLNGKTILKVVPTDDSKGAVVHTNDGGTYFLTPEETKKQLNIVIQKPTDQEKGSDVFIPEVKIMVSDTIKAKPLYVINGVEGDENFLKTLNLKDIESINVLKGASAIEQYGDKAKNGVIIIKTKFEKLAEITVNDYKTPITSNRTTTDKIIIGHRGPIIKNDNETSTDKVVIGHKEP